MGSPQGSAPTVNPQATSEQIGIYNQNIGKTTAATTAANQRSIASDTRFGLDMFDDSGNLLNKEELDKLNKQQTTDETTLTRLEARLARTKNPKTQATLQARIDALKPKIATRTEQITTLSDPNYAANRIKGAFSEQYGRRDNLVSDMEAARAPTSEYTRMQDAFGRGITARTANTAQASAAGIGQVADVRAREVGAGALGDTLMGRAMTMARSDGSLSEQATRDAIQSSRQGFAARGMATGSAALGAELLNRDRYARQRMFQDLGFAQGIQDQDLKRQFDNSGNVLLADQGNQRTQLSREDRISLNQQSTNEANMLATNNMSQFNAGQLTDADKYNMGLLESASLRANQEKNANLALGTDIYNFTMATDPKLIAAGVGSPYANLTGSTQMAGQVVGAATANPQYTGGNFSGGGTDWVAAAATGVQAGADIYSASDRRMKKDIKQVGGKDALGLKTYQFRFKGEPDNAPKRTGYMAQDVKKVLPEAVRTFNHNGEKRMAIKPRVIGQALTEALAEQQRGMFTKGYRVGAGL
jgi:hypothetical protein